MAISPPEESITAALPVPAQVKGMGKSKYRYIYR